LWRAWPGQGGITGMGLDAELQGKRIELLRELIPGLLVVGEQAVEVHERPSADGREDLVLRRAVVRVEFQRGEPGAWPKSAIAIITTIHAMPPALPRTARLQRRDMTMVSLSTDPKPILLLGHLARRLPRGLRDEPRPFPAEGKGRMRSFRR
jgi:hypothetical protein